MTEERGDYVTECREISTSADELEQLRQRVEVINQAAEQGAINPALSATPTIDLLGDWVNEARAWARYLYQLLEQHAEVCVTCGLPLQRITDISLCDHWVCPEHG